MKWSNSVANKAALALLAADKAVGDVLTVIEPCPSATSLTIPPITVTAQYQPVSTCEPTTACVKGTCATLYPLTTFPYVSTVVPFAWNGTTTQLTTVTDIAQPFRASEYLETLTQVTAAPSIDKRSWVDWFDKKRPTSKSTTVYETVTRRAMAPYKDVGPLAIPGWEGSGLCAKCEDKTGGGRSQLLDVVECRSGVDAAGKSYEECVEWYETLIERPAPTSKVTAEALCSSKGKIPHAGVYTWTFPQIAPPVTITAPPTTVTVTVNGRPSMHVIPKQVNVVSGQAWNAYVTKSFSGPTTFNFNVYITKIIIINVPHITQPASKTRNVPVPTGKGNKGGNWWPLPEQDQEEDAGQAWEDWNSATSSSSTGGPIGQSTTSSWRWSSSITTTSTSSSATGGPIGASTSSSSSSSSSSSGTVGPIGASTSSSSTSSMMSSSSSSSTSSMMAASSSSSSSSTSSTSSMMAASSSSSSSSTSSMMSSSSSSSSTSSMMAASSSSSSSSSTSAFATTTSITATGTGFYLQISATAVAKHRRQLVVRYLGFDENDNGIVVDDEASATLVFQGTSSALLSADGEFLGTEERDTSFVRLLANLPAGFRRWTFVDSMAQLQGTSGFCLGVNGVVSAYVAPDTCDNPIVLIRQPPTSSTSTSSTSATSTSSSTSSNGGATTTTTTAAETSTTTTSSNGGATTTTTTTAAETSTTTTSTAGGASSSSASSSSSSVGPIDSSTSSSFPTTSAASTSSLTTITSTTSSAPATTTTGAPLCNINANICLDSDLITANIVATQDCPLLGGLTCTINDLLSLVPELLGGNPDVASVLIANNQILGLSITPEELQTAINAGELNTVCTALETVSVVIDDPTCPANPTFSTSTTFATSTSSSSAGNGASTTTANAPTTTSAATTTAGNGATTTTGGAASSTTSAGSSPTCGVQVELCAGQTLQDVGLNEVACDSGIAGVVCSLAQTLEAATNACVGNCQIVGRTGEVGLNLDPLTGIESIQSVQAAVADYPNCQPGGPTVTLSEPTCPLSLFKRTTRNHRFARF